MKDRNNYLRCFIEVFILKKLSDSMIDKIGTDFEIELQDFIGSNLKPEFSNWITSLSIIESAENSYRDAVANGNIKI